MTNKRTDLLALDRVLELGARSLAPDLFVNLEQAVSEIKQSIETRSRKELPTSLTLCEWELGNTRELLAAAYIRISGNATHTLNCATSCAPASLPGECDCSPRQ